MMAIQFELHRCLHKAFRKRSAELLVALGQADLSDDAIRSRLLRDANKLLRLLARHDLHEEAFVHPCVARESAFIANRLDAEHCDHVAVIAEVKRCMDALQHAPRRNRAKKGHELYLAFGRMFASDLLHMDYEEREALPCLGSESEDPAVQEACNGFLGDIAPDELMETLRAVLPAVDPNECARIVSGVKQCLPPEMSTTFVPYIVQPMLAPKQYQRLLASLDNLTDVLAKASAPDGSPAH